PKKNRPTTGTSPSAGIFPPKSPQTDTNLMVSQSAYSNEPRSSGKETSGWMTLRPTPPAMNDRVEKTIDQMFANSSDETSTDTEKAFNKAFVAQLGNIALIVGLVVGAAFATILMIVGNTLIMALRERTREIAVLKTLGFPASRILRLVLGESLLLAFLGGLPGLGIAMLVAASMRESLGNFVPRLAITPEIAVAAIALMICFGLATGVIPALNAMRLKIATALGRS